MSFFKTVLFIVVFSISLLHLPGCQKPLAVTGRSVEESSAAAAEKSLAQRKAEFLDLKFGMFIHFNMASYKNTQWVAGYHNPADFNPGVDRIDTDAWADAAKSAGMTYAVLTVKHVAGFCLWDSAYTTYDVMHPDCPYQQDLVAQFIESFTSRGLKVGLYYCWRSPGFAERYKVLPPECDPATHSFDEQIAFQKKQLVELIERYPDVFYLWNDGLDSEVLSAEQANAFIRSLGPGVIAAGNWWDWGKKGQPFVDIAVKEMKPFPADNSYTGETCWSLEEKWFWSDGYQPKSAQGMVDRLEQANSRGSNFLLNVGPNRQGRFSEASVRTLAEMGRLRDASKDAGSQ